MDRCLIVANKTLLSHELLEAMQTRMKERDCSFHLLVPATHPWGAWSEGSVRAAAWARLEEGLKHFADEGIPCTGEIGDANPVHAVTDVLLRERFDEIVLSTLPPGPSAWIHQHVPARLARTVPTPVSHVITANPKARVPVY
jgi:hypothetical protein